jgi:hypothetical protein
MRRPELLITEAVYRSALKDYLVIVVGDLLRARHPRLFFSRQVVVASHNISFAVDHMTIAGLR